MAYAASGMEASQANELVSALLTKYEDQIENPPVGKIYQECFDLDTNKPTGEYLRLYQETKAELTQMGIEFRF